MDYYKLILLFRRIRARFKNCSIFASDVAQVLLSSCYSICCLHITSSAFQNGRQGRRSVAFLYIEHHACSE